MTTENLRVAYKALALTKVDENLLRTATFVDNTRNYPVLKNNTDGSFCN